MTTSHITNGHRESTSPGFLPGTAYAVLGLLSFGPELSGYELRQLALNSLRFFYWTPAQSQIYRELRRLAGLGYVTGREVSQDSRPDKVAYSRPAGPS
jgi:DNA-binding PadR family transcriptional regulator